MDIKRYVCCWGEMRSIENEPDTSITFQYVKAADYDALRAENEDLRRQLAITSLSVPLETDLSDKIDEMLKHLAYEQGFTLNGIARLLIDVQRRMAADWTEIGRLRRSAKQSTTDVEQLRAEQARLTEELAGEK